MAVLVLVYSAGFVFAADQDAVDGCIDQLFNVGGPDAQSGARY